MRILMAVNNTEVCALAFDGERYLTCMSGKIENGEPVIDTTGYEQGLANRALYLALYGALENALTLSRQAA